MIPVTTFAGKTVAVFGLGASGNATALALMAGGATVAAWDDGAGGRAGAEKAGIALVDLNTADWSQFAALILAPGVPLTHPEPHWTVQKAKAAGIEIIGDIELFCRERNKLGGRLSAEDQHAPDAPFIAITGTNGKSTTTALIAHILREAGMDVQMGGNIGVPILALEPPSKDRFHVIEISSFQIDLTPSVNPTVGVLLNITPDHLDRHGSLANYAAVKARLVAAADIAVIGPNDRACVDICDQLRRSRQAIMTFATGDGGDICSKNGMLVRGETHEPAADLSGVPTLRGAHNGENAAAAFAVLSIVGLDDATIARHMRTYPGLPHRMEEVGRVGNVSFVNDSKATNADSTEKALLSFPRDVFWIVGGKAKEGGIESLRPYFPGIVRAYLIGAASDAFSETLDGDVAIIPCGTLDVAVARAAADAAAYNDATIPSPVPSRGEGEGRQRPHVELVTAPHPDPLPMQGQSMGRGGSAPVVLLSPACASYDQFRSFEHRGDSFRALVSALPGFIPARSP
jgi:UDP-N-acetylmuramoylalanine--D-glutamate ligase